MRQSSVGLNDHSSKGGILCLNLELWHACAGPLVSLPAIGTKVMYFPQGHIEQVASSINKDVDVQVPNYPSLPPQLICQLHNVTMHTDIETDEVYAQLTLQPLSPQEQKEVSFKPSDLDFQSKQPRNYFCKTLTASDTSTHGGFSVPRRAAERVFPPLDLSQQPPAQELIARDLNDNEWKFRHIFRGQPKRHLLTTGWSVFVSAKGLVAGDSVIFIWNENNRLFLGIRRANRTQTATPSSVISSDNMHLGLLAAAAHAANTNSRFTIFYSPRASPSEFVVPLAKYVKAVYHTQVSIGMRFKMLFETEESTVRRHMGTITGISDSDPARWPNSHWRSVKVGWDESGAGDKQTSVSLWEIEPLTTFSMYPNPFPSRLKRPWTHALPSFSGMRDDDMGIGMNSYRNLQGIDVSPLMQPSSIDLGIQNDLYQAMVATTDFPVSRNIGISDQALSFRQFNQMLDMANYSDSLMQPQISQKHQLQHPSEPQQRILNDFEQFSAAMPVMSRFESNSQPQSPSFQFGSHLINVPSSSTTSLSPNGLPPKRVAVDPLPRNVSSPVDQLGDLNTILYSSSTSLPRTDCRFIDQQSVDDIQTFAVNMHPNINRVHDHNDSVSVPYGGDFALSSIASRMPSRTFVKVYKSRSYTRSLDISKFSSYHELRSELARMFGLEGLLENPSRSCWQLIFVDRENDVLLLGDDPWPDFVHNVWYIMILSPGEMQQYMGNQGPELSVHSVQ